MRFLGAAAAALTAACLAGCTTPAQGFYWGSYDQSLYAFSKRAEKRDDYAAALQKAIDRGRATKRLAPGLQAELGFLKLENGDVAGAVTLFEAEAASFPESATFMRRVITAASASRGAAAPDAGAAVTQPGQNRPQS